MKRAVKHQSRAIGLQSAVFVLGITMLHVSSNLNNYTNNPSHTHTLAFCLSVNWKSIGIHPPWNTVTFPHPLPMIRNKLWQRLIDIWGAGGRLEWSVKHQQRCIHALCGCVCACVCTCMCLSDQGRTLLLAAQPAGPVGIM